MGCPEINLELFPFESYTTRIHCHSIANYIDIPFSLRHLHQVMSHDPITDSRFTT